MRINNAIRKNSFAMYFECDNTPNCFAITRDGSELSELIEDGKYFMAKEIDGKRVKVEIDGKIFILSERLRTRNAAKGCTHWMAHKGVPPQLVNLLPVPGQTDQEGR